MDNEKGLQFKGLDIDLFAYIYTQCVGNLSAVYPLSPSASSKAALDHARVAYSQYLRALDSGLIEEIKKEIDDQSQSDE